MQHGERKSSRAPKKLFAGIAALGVAAGAYGVYATTLDVDGSAGTELQAGTTSVTPDTSCQTSEMTVTENFSASVFTEGAGYSAPERTGWTISGIMAGCNGQTIALAVNSDAAAADAATAFVEVGSGAFSSADGNTVMTFAVPDPYAADATDETDTKGYSIKIS